VRLALDDFGTGYSSLYSLSQLPVDFLKIPRPFLQPSVHRGGRAFGLLAGMIDLGGHLGVTTVAEGIETAEQRELVMSFGCHLGQGYLLGRPLEAAAAGQLLRDQRAALAA
jgi:EAL domain-containing protein (putative c-di-GMP-specific phosphodiesterase class I)